MASPGGRTRASQIAAVICLSLSAAILWAPPASTQTAETATVSTSVEAWYYVADDTTAPAPLPAPLPAVPDPTNPYGENTLHTSITGGNEDSRTYITLDLAGLPTTFELLQGTLELPVDPEGVTIGADTARVQICLAQPPAESVEGSFEEPPEVDCATKAPATYAEKPFPHLKADITDFGADLGFSGLAILASDRAKEKSDTWHVTFYGDKNESENAKPITARLTFVEPDPLFGDDFTDDSNSGFVPDLSPEEPSGTTFDTGTAPTFDFGDAPSDTGGAQDDPIEETVQEPTEVAAEEPPQLELAVAETRPPYSIVWAVPLLLLAFATYFSSALTRVIDLRQNRS